MFLNIYLGIAFLKISFSIHFLWNIGMNDFIFLTNIEKLTYFLIHFLDIFKFLKYLFENFTHFKKFNVFFWNFTYFSEISCIYKYVKSCICPLGLHYEIRECAYLSPRGIASKFKNAIKNIFTKFFLIQSCKKLV